MLEIQLEPEVMIKISLDLLPHRWPSLSVSRPSHDKVVEAMLNSLGFGFLSSKCKGGRCVGFYLV